MVAWFLPAAALLAVSAGAGSQDPVTELPGVQVTGPPLTIEAAESFVDEVAARPYGALTLGRWETPLCLRLHNLEGEKPELILWRIRMRAEQAGAPLAEGDCRPNVSIVLTADGARTARELVAASPKSFYASPGPTQRGRADLRRFRESDAPIRWWHVSGLYDTHHRVFISSNGPTPLIVNTDGSPYFNQDRRQAFLTAMVVVDVTRLNGVDLNTLADYLAFVILAEVEPQDGRSDFPSILNLWEEGSDVQSLSDWDVGYLSGLYRADVRITGSSVAFETGYQQAEIARSVLAAAEAGSGR